LVFVDEAVAAGRFQNSKVMSLHWRWRLGGLGWLLVERAVGSVRVVLVDVVNNEPFELVLVPDDCVVKEFAADGSDPAFGEGVRDWCADGGFEDFEAFGVEDLVEGVDALAASVANEGS
jgi:hypothetical protein